MFLIPSIGSALGVRVYQIANGNDTIVSPVSLKVSSRIAFWNENVAAAEARKAEGAEMLALIIIVIINIIIIIIFNIIYYYYYYYYYYYSFILSDFADDKNQNFVIFNMVSR